MAKNIGFNGQTTISNELTPNVNLGIPKRYEERNGLINKIIPNKVANEIVAARFPKNNPSFM